MKKILLALMFFASTSQADVLRTYDVHATVSGWMDLPSCDASERMLTDRHRIVWHDDWSVWINGFEWNVVPSDDPASILLTFHEGHGRLVSLTMELTVNDRSLIGTYTLYGVRNRDKNGWQECADRVELRGVRR